MRLRSVLAAAAVFGMLATTAACGSNDETSATSTVEVPEIAILNLANVPSLNDIVDGVTAGLAAAGYSGSKIKIDSQNANGDISVAQSIAAKFAQAKPDAIVTVSTPALQAAITAARRETWGVSDEPMPSVPPPAQVPVYPPLAGVEWLQRYEMRAIEGLIPHTWDGSGSGSLTQLWVRDAPARPLDFCALAALADVFFPRVWLRRARQVPAGTVSITVYFHATAEQLQTTGTGFLLGQARGQEFRNGFFDQTAQLWNEGGALLATTHQIVYYKE